MSLEGISRRGKKGLSVPANTINPSLNFSRAKARASASLSNVRVSRGLRRFGKVPRFCTSNVTYQVCGIRQLPDRDQADICRRTMIGESMLTS
jgi:hypothetical protein